MNDGIVERLRHRAEELGTGNMPYGLLVDAANEIERLDMLAQSARANALQEALQICINAEGDIDLAAWEIRILIKEVSEGR